MNGPSECKIVQKRWVSEFIEGPRFPFLIGDLRKISGSWLRKDSDFAWPSPQIHTLLRGPATLPKMFSSKDM
jgi:hypothetical protein